MAQRSQCSMSSVSANLSPAQRQRCRCFPILRMQTPVSLSGRPLAVEAEAEELVQSVRQVRPVRRVRKVHLEVRARRGVRVQLVRPPRALGRVVQLVLTARLVRLVRLGLRGLRVRSVRLVLWGLRVRQDLRVALVLWEALVLWALRVRQVLKGRKVLRVRRAESSRSSWSPPRTTPLFLLPLPLRIPSPSVPPFPPHSWESPMMCP